MSNEFEVERQSEDLPPDRPDPEEPSTWEATEAQTDAEIDERDWADQHTLVDATVADEEHGDANTVTIDPNDV
ncbi:MAG: hypothetical protein WD023_08395 [Ilumatobacteraceae bacterium]